MYLGKIKTVEQKLKEKCQSNKSLQQQMKQLQSTFKSSVNSKESRKIDKLAHDILHTIDNENINDPELNNMIKYGNNSFQHTSLMNVGAVDLARETCRLNLSDRTGEKRQYSKGYLHFVQILVRLLGSSGYKRLRKLNMYPLPSYSYLCSLLKATADQGVTYEAVLQFYQAGLRFIESSFGVDLTNLSSEDRAQTLKALYQVHLSFDEIQLKQHYAWDKKAKRIIGTIDGLAAIGLDDDLSQSVANYATLFSLRSTVFSNFRFPLAVIGQHGAGTAAQVKQMLDRVLQDFFDLVDSISDTCYLVDAKDRSLIAEAKELTVIDFIVCDAASSHSKPLRDIAKERGIEWVPETTHLFKRWKNHLLSILEGHSMNTPWGRVSKGPIKRLISRVLYHYQTHQEFPGLLLFQTHFQR